MPSTNERVAELLEEWADLLEISGADSFRVRAYQKAARAIAGHPKDVRDLDGKALRGIPSVGAHMAGRVREYVDTGSLAELDDLRESVPAGVRDLMRVPGLGPKKAVLLNRELGVSSIPELLAAIRARRLRDIKGLGPKTEENLLRAVRSVKEDGERIGLDVALSIAGEIADALGARGAVEAAVVAGSARRMRETVGDIDVLVSSKRPRQVMESFVSLDSVAHVQAKGDTKSSVVTESGLQVDLRVVSPEVFGAALVYFTGSKAHNIKIREIAVRNGLKLSEYGLFRARSGRRIAARTEEDVYAALGLPWIPPPMREDTGEVEAAARGELPAVVTEADLRGDLHTHTDLTDGLAPLEEMVQWAAMRGHRYYAVTDHAEKLAMTGMKREAVLAQRDKIRSLQARYPKMALLHGAELNIGKDGDVDYDAEFLSEFDFLVASVHSHFNLPPDEMTRRIIRAVSNPFVNVIGHPTTRLIGKRAGVEFDFEAVSEACARTGTALEVNSFPDRLDLRDEHVRWAVERGVTIAISTDAHSPLHLSNLRYGVGTAQRGWLPRSLTLNARGLRDLRTFVRAKRRK